MFDSCHSDKSTKSKPKHVVFDAIFNEKLLQTNFASAKIFQHT